MVLRILTWLISLAVHGSLAAIMLLPAGGTALHEGAGEDIMVVEQGIALEGVAKLGEDFISVDPIEAPPVQTVMAQPMPEEVKPPVEHEELPVEEVPEEVTPIEEQEVIASETGPDQANVRPPDEIDQPEPEDVEEQIHQEEITELRPEEVKEPEREEVKEPERELVEEPDPDLVEQPLPQQMATLTQESVAAQLQSSAKEKRGGDTTAHSAYLGELRTLLERGKVNPRTTLVGTAVVRFKVGPNGEVMARRVVKSSGSKVLDDAALASVERAAPFPPIPKTLQRSELEISVPFRFTVR